MSTPGSRVIQISILKCCNVRGSRSPTSVQVRVDHGDVSLKASSKVEQVEGAVEVNHSVQLECPADLSTEAWIDRLISQPLIFSLLEVVSAGKDKRGGGGAGSKEEKTITIGQCCVDLLAFLKLANPGEPRCVPMTLTVLASGTDSPMAAPPSAPCSLDIELSVAAGFQAELTEGSRVVRACVDSLYLPPSQWSSVSNDISYAIGLPLPIAESKYRTVTYLGGVYQPAPGQGKGATHESVPRCRHWNSTQVAHANCALLPSSLVSSPLLDEEDGELHDGTAALQLRRKAEKGARVDWHAEGRTFVPEGSVASFYAALRERTLWPVEVVRVQTVAAVPAKGKRLSAAQEASSDCQFSFHGVAYVDLAPLLYPGCTRVQGVYRLHPYSDAETLARTGRKADLTDILMQQSGSAGERLKSAAQKKRTTSTSKLSAGDSGDGGVKAATTPPESAAYTERNTYIKLEVTLDQPLIRKRPIHDIEEDITLLLPTYDLGSQESAEQQGSTKPLEELHGKLQDIATQVRQALHTIICRHVDRLNKARRVAKQDDGPRTFKDILKQPEILQTVQKDLSQELISSGVYSRMQEQLRQALVRVIRNRFGQVSAAKTEKELQKLLPQLHLFISREINQCLNEWGRKQSCPPEVSPAPLPSSTFLLFAQEAESERQWKVAARYYQKCIELDRTPEYLFENAKFCLNTGDQQVAFSNLMAAIALQMDHIPSLLLYAMLSAVQGHVPQAALFLEAAIEYNNPEYGCMPRVLLGLLHDMSGDLQARNHTFRDARQQVRAAQLADGSRGKTEQGDKLPTDSTPKPTIDVTAASSRTTTATSDIRTSPTAEAGESVEGKIADGGMALLTSQTSVKSTASIGSLNEKGGGSQASVATTSPRHNDPAVTPKRRLSVTSPLNSAPSKTVSPQESAFDTGLSDSKAEIPLVFLETAVFATSCHVPHFAALALHHHRVVHAASREYYIAMARLCMERGHYVAAEESVEEALKFSYENPETWALSGHLRYIQGAPEEAKKCYERCVALEGHASEEHIIYLRLGNIYLAFEEFEKAKKAFLLAAQNRASAKAWMGVGKSCYRLNLLQEAEAALLEANTLNREEPEVWAYLSLVSLKCNRRLPAERTFQYAMKTGLRDGALAQELAALQAEKGFGDPADVVRA